jgi:DNA invertase Pin-like site-specific DNA recombinase
MKATSSAAALPDLHAPPEPPDVDLDDLISRVQSTQIAPGRRLIAIVRVSKTKGREGEGFIAPDEQIGKMQGYAKSHGSEIVDVRREMDVSGGSVDREVLMGAVADVIAGKADGVIVARVNRYARTTAGLQMVRKLQAAGKTFVAVDEGIGPEMLQTSCGWFTFTIMLAVAELQLAMLTEGFNTARQMHIAAGIANQVPYGYRRRAATETDRPRRLEPDPLTAPHVVFIFERRAAGDSWIAIARALDARGAPTPGGSECWLYTRVRHIVQNRTYLGELTSGEFMNPAAHAPLVSAELWETANGLNQTPARNGAAAYCLTGILRCATCGGRMVGFMQTVKAGRKRDGEPRKYPYYRCRRNYSWGRCPAPASAPAGELEALVMETFFRRFTRELNFERRADDRSAELAAAQTVIDEANAAMDRFLTSPATARLVALRGPGWYDEQIERLADELEAAQEAWQEIRNAVAGMDLPAGLEEGWHELALDAQRGFLSAAFGVVAVKSSGGRRVPVDERVHIWARNEAGSPEIALAARDANGRIVRVPIDF